MTLSLHSGIPKTLRTALPYLIHVCVAFCWCCPCVYFLVYLLDSVRYMCPQRSHFENMSFPIHLTSSVPWHEWNWKQLLYMTYPSKISDVYWPDNCCLTGRSFCKWVCLDNSDLLEVWKHFFIVWKVLSNFCNTCRQILCSPSLLTAMLNVDPATIIAAPGFGQ